MDLDRKRWLVIVGGVCANLCAGSAYAFSVYSGPLEDLLGAAKPEVAIAFSFSLAFLPVGMMIAGPMVDRGRTRLAVLIGGGIFSLGMFLASYSSSLLWLYVTYGGMMSLGNGATYGAAVSAAVKWFPERSGAASGIVVSALGAGSLIIAPLAGWLIPQVGISGAFRILGVAFAVAMLIAAKLIVSPPPDYRPRAVGSRPEPASADPCREVSWKQMVRRPLFARLFVLYLLGTFSGLMVMSQASSISQEIAGLSAAAASLVVGMLGAANSAGRLFWGAASDRLGRMRVLGLMFTLTALAMIALAQFVHGPAALIPAFFLAGLCYGGYLGVFPSVCADAFGGLNLGVNYAVLFVAFSTSGVIGPQVVSVLRVNTGSYTPAFWAAVGVCAVGLALTLLTRLDDGSAPAEAGRRKH